MVYACSPKVRPGPARRGIVYRDNHAGILAEKRQKEPEKGVAQLVPSPYGAGEEPIET